MSFVVVARFNKFRLVANGSKQISSQLMRASANKVQFRRDFHYHREKKKKTLMVTLISTGVLLVPYFTITGYLHSDSGFNRSFSTSTRQSNENNSNKQNIFLLNEEEVTKRLRQLEESYFVNRGQGVVRYDISQLPSNNPIEDDRSESIITVPILNQDNERKETDLYFWGIYDGHSGYYTSLKLKNDLINYVANELGAIYKVDDNSLKTDTRIIPSSEAIDNAIKQGFLKLDHEIVYNSLTDLLNNPNDKKKLINALPATSGACGLLTFYDANSSNLKVAVTGDSRVLLGSVNEDNQWTCKSLSVDQTGDNPYEVKRIQSEHPGEPDVIKHGRVLGSLQPTRAFGDFRYKLKEINGKLISELPEHLRFYFRSPPKNLLTPPYVTAEPVVSTTKINPGKNDFIVIGSDGLYELLSDEEIVGLVVKWMDKNKLSQQQKQEETKKWNLFNSDDLKLPKVVNLTDAEIQKFQRPPFRNNQKPGSTNDHDILLQDENCSTHLIRNALSLGGSKEYLSTLVSIPSPTSRRYRDDLTVTVVFFGDSANRDGSITTNQSATANNNAPVSPKL